METWAMKPHDPDYIRSLSDAVLKTAQDVVECSVTDSGWQTLIEAGLELRRLAVLEMPWEDEMREKGGVETSSKSALFSALSERQRDVDKGDHYSRKRRASKCA